MAFPLWLFAMFSSWGFAWYYGLSILAGELLLFYFCGFLGGFVLMFRDMRPSLCPKCGGVVLLNGSYFKGDTKPNLEDFVLSILYVGVNVGFWVFILTKGLLQ
jgi:hypothetical protein